MLEGKDNTQKTGNSRIILSGAKKRATSVREQCKWMCKEYGKGRVVTLSLTFPNKGNLPRAECERRYHSLMTNHLRKVFLCGVMVFERSKSGRPHYHGFCVLRAEVDVSAGFNWAAYDANLKAAAEYRKDPTRKNWGKKMSTAKLYGSSATGELRNLWKLSFSRPTMAKYNFGIAHITPVRNSEAAAVYQAKYLTKADPSGGKYADEDKGRRTFRMFGKMPRKCSLQHQPLTPSSFIFRRKLEHAANLLGMSKYDDYADTLGPRWFHYLGDAIQDLPALYVMSVMANGREVFLEKGVRTWSWVEEGRRAEARITRCFAACFDERDRDLPSPKKETCFLPPTASGQKMVSSNFLLNGNDGTERACKDLPTQQPLSLSGA